MKWALLLFTVACAQGTGGLNTAPGAASGPAQADAGPVQAPVTAAAPTMEDSTLILWPEVEGDNFALMDCRWTVSNPPCLRRVDVDKPEDCPTIYELTGTVTQARKQDLNGDCSAYSHLRILNIDRKEYKDQALPASCTFTATMRGDSNSKFYFYIAKNGVAVPTALKEVDSTFTTSGGFNTTRPEVIPCTENCFPPSTIWISLVPAADSSCRRSLTSGSPDTIKLQDI